MPLRSNLRLSELRPIKREIDLESYDERHRIAEIFREDPLTASGNDKIIFGLYSHLGSERLSEFVMKYLKLKWNNDLQPVFWRKFNVNEREHLIETLNNLIKSFDEQKLHIQKIPDDERIQSEFGKKAIFMRIMIDKIAISYKAYLTIIINDIRRSITAERIHKGYVKS